MVVPFLLACAFEGDDAEECRDGADNDRNGAFDCDDAGCAASPDCTGVADTADAEGDTDTDTDTDTDEMSDYASFALGYDFSWDFDDTYAAVLDLYDLADCTTSYAAEGSFLSAAGLVATFDGSWTLTGSDCNATLLGSAWYDADTGAAFATFHFAESGSVLDDWIEHRDVEDTEPLSEPSKQGQWYITDMAEPVGADAVSHFEEESLNLLDIPVVIGHQLDVVFTPR